MKIIFTSDLHINQIEDHPLATYRNFLDRLYKESPDLIVLAGDIINRASYWPEFFSKYNKIVRNTKTMLLLGNHDFWDLENNRYRGYKANNWTREEIYTRIQEESDKKNIIFLEEEPQVIGRTLFCGTVGWYDYSAKLEEDNVEYLEKNKGLFNNDGNYMFSSISDIDYANLCKKRLFKNIKQHQKDVDHIVVFTHVPVFRDCVVPAPAGMNPYSWRRSNAYFFNFSLGDSLLKNKKVRLVASGHIHRKTEGVLNNGIKYLTCGSDYDRPEYSVINLDENTGQIDFI